MTKSYLERFYKYVAWANDRACDAIAQLPVESPQSKQALRLLGHILNAAELWRRVRILSEDLPGFTVWPEYSLETCRTKNSEEEVTFARYFQSISEKDLERPVTYNNLTGNRFTGSVLDILMHAANHATHHRGQIMQLVRQGGGTPASTDFIAFTRLSTEHA
jgi:uncharacterized damage-inducible protein DinB